MTGGWRWREEIIPRYRADRSWLTPFISTMHTHIPTMMGCMILDGVLAEPRAVWHFALATARRSRATHFDRNGRDRDRERVVIIVTRLRERERGRVTDANLDS